MKTPFFYVVQDIIVDVIQQGKLDSLLLMRNVEALTQYERFMDTLTLRVTRCKLMIKPMTGQVELHIIKIKLQQRVAHKLQQQFLDTTY